MPHNIARYYGGLAAAVLRDFPTPSVDLRVPANLIQEIVKGDRAMTPDTALRLARYLGATAQFWLNRQSRSGLQTAQKMNWPSGLRARCSRGQSKEE